LLKLILSTIRGLVVKLLKQHSRRERRLKGLYTRKQSARVYEKLRERQNRTGKDWRWKLLKQAMLVTLAVAQREGEVQHRQL